jgi:DNA polymerase III alpha subunit
LGYKISKPDINHSSAREWHILDDKTCTPPLVAVKGIGVTAADELVNTRPRNGFKNLRDFFFDGSDYWRWSKLNKKSLEALIRTEAFNSINAIGDHSVFKNYKHFYNTMFESEQVDKKTFKLDKLKRDWTTIEKASLVVSSDDWTTVEKVVMQRELLGFYDKNLIIGKFLKTFKEFGVQAVDDTEDKLDKRKVWALIETIQKKETKAGKEFLVVGATGNTDKMYSFRVWEPTDIWKEGNVLIIDLTYQDNFGYSVPRQCKPLKITK